MENEVYWLKPGKVLYVHYQGYQTVEAVLACMDQQADELDKAEQPVFVLVNWLDVTGADPKVIKSSRGHRGYSHPMAARGVLVGMDRQQAFENELAAQTTRQSQHTRYFDTMDEALHYLRDFVGDD